MLPEPVRDPASVRAHVGSYVGYFPSRKMDRLISYESTGELHAAILNELNPHITAYVEQPYCWKYMHEGKQRKYTPDFLVFRNGEKWIEEVKPSRKVHKPDMQKLLFARKKFVESKGFKFRVVTELNTMRQPRLDNAEVILRYAYPNWREADQQMLLAAFDNVDQQDLKTTIDKMGTDDAHAIICTGFCMGLIETDMSKPFNLQSPIKLFNKEKTHAE